MKITVPHEPFNSYIKNGSAQQLMQQIMGGLKPEAAYFSEMTGKRTCILILNMEHPSQMPEIAEPWFLKFNADVEFHPCMLPEDLGKADLQALGKKWG
jgi:hypothetical protein